MLSRSQLLSYIPVTLAVGLALGLTLLDAQIHPRSELFELNSLKALRTLNYQYQMNVEDLLIDKESESALIAELYKADALIPVQEKKDNKGLVVSLKEEEHLLLLQPQDPLSDEKLAEIADQYARSIPEFAHVELDQEVSLESPVYEWELNPMASQPVALSSEPLNEVVVAVIDSGVDEGHEIFADVSIQKGWNTLKDDETMVDDVGHGTHIAGIIAAHAPGVSLVPYKIVDSKGGKLSNVLEAFSKAMQDGVTVVNASFGLSTSSYALENLIAKAYDQGIIVVSAAGNSGKDVGFYPASYAQSLAVGSVDAGGHQMPSSNYGNWVDVAAYGYRVKSSLPGNEYGYKSGTSQATAFVTAAVARLLMQDPELSFSEILEALEASSAEQVKTGELAGISIVE
ncbi:S8 family serine peptidase [Candidatus Peregrinibacteria bacterium]|nr:MAG: S8 family serine peptidase [Candidatus Peregrinibacteria bacterium]